MGIQRRVLGLIAFFLLVAFSAVEVRSYYQLKAYAEESLRTQAEIVQGLLMSIRRVYHHAFLDSHIPLSSDTVPLLPAHAINRISKEFPTWFKGGVSFNNVSDKPRNEQQRAKGIEQQAMAHFRQNPEEKRWFTQYQEENGEAYYHYATPIWIEPYCMQCHGAKEKAPAAIQKMYSTGFDYKIGDLRGVVSIKLPAAHINRLVKQQFLENSLIHLLIFGSAFFAISFFLRRDVGQPLEAISHAVRKFGQTRELPKFEEQPGEFQILLHTLTDMASTVVLRESEVQERQLQIELLLDSAGEGIYAIDTQGICIQCNPAAVALLGYASSTELVGRDIHTLCHRADEQGTHMPHSDCPGCKVIASGEPVHLAQEYLQRQDGSVFPVEMRIHPMHQGGRVVGAVVLFDDISRRLDAEQKLRLSERHFRTLVQALPGTFYKCAPDPLCTMYSLGDNIAELTGYAADSFIENHERSFSSVVHAEDWPRVREALDQALAQGVVYHLEYRVNHTDGKPRWVMDRGQAVYDEAGRAEVLYGVLLDMTERKQYEQRLESARQQADAGNRAKSEFLAVMSHEIRTPLNAIMGMGDLLGETALSPVQRHYLSISQHAGETLVELIEDILDLSRIEVGELELEPAPFEVEALVEEVCEVVTSSAHDKGLILLMRIDPLLPPVLIGDKKRLRQILFNLLFNAVKFTKHGEVMLDIRHDAARSAAGAVLLQVRDTGVGMAEEMIERVFEPFTQGDSTITRQYGGSGLGLTICKRLVSKMGGDIQLESALGRGTTATVQLVLPVGRHGMVAAVRQQVPLHGANLLLVDDNANNREIYTELLQQEGARVVGCATGETAMQQVSEANFDLAVLDFHMPSEDGLTLAGRIQEMVPNMPLLMLSSDQQPAAAARANSMGVTFLLKPVKRQLLRQTIAQLMQSGKGVKDAPVLGQGVESGPQKGLKILLAEDVPENALLIEAYLEETGHQISVVGDGQQAFERFQEEPFDLVLMDLQMPVMNGLQATRHIRAWEQAQGVKRTPILALTAHAMKEDESKSLEAGCDGHLTKPIRKQVFLQKLQGFLG
ncbi:PAS/PAC sensor hybrid histidine kinase [Magnetococcus marinus MC-1]|uniref:histidine kinase n=1 Tax=Magnetococcus marinus (strain ATCC BAA-1437 / JCM 17883 / MC-1) TaxID=156889 RepID=A0L5C5_MAGMM|nr:response regulator [Magnetococcus marinus]ABK43168.1 PAS/PAC sensor hybrid histidine kinase [Magnetococcus marinus MC-1]